MIVPPRLTNKEWQNLRRRRLVGPKLAGIEVPCTECGALFVRQRGARTLCAVCSGKADDARQNDKKRSRRERRDADDALDQWLKYELGEFEHLDRFQQASYTYELERQIQAQRQDERDEANRHRTELEKIKETFQYAERYVVEQPLKHALSPDGPDEGYSTYFLPRTEDGYLEADVDWEWRTDQAAKWWRDNPHAFADLV